MWKLGKIRGGPDAGEVSGRVMEVLAEVMRETGAELAAELAENSRPRSKAEGDRAAAGDIDSLFAGPGRVARVLKEESPRKAGAWMAAIEGGAGRARLEEILKGTRLAGVTILEEPDRQVHEAFLRGGHRRRSKPAAIISRREAHAEFVRAKQAQVGSARKGWQDAGADLGGPGGGWPLSGKRRGAGRLRRIGRRVRVELINFLPYSRYLFDAGERRRLVEGTKRKVLAKLAGRL